MAEILHGDGWIALYVENQLVWCYHSEDNFEISDLQQIVEALLGIHEGNNVYYCEENYPPEAINQDE